MRKTATTLNKIGMQTHNMFRHQTATPWNGN